MLKETSRQKANQEAAPISEHDPNELMTRMKERAAIEVMAGMPVQKAVALVVDFAIKKFGADTFSSVTEALTIGPNSEPHTAREQIIVTVQNSEEVKNAAHEFYQKNHRPDKSEKQESPIESVDDNVPIMNEQMFAAAHDRLEASYRKAQQEDDHTPAGQAIREFAPIRVAREIANDQEIVMFVAREMGYSSRPNGKDRISMLVKYLNKKMADEVKAQVTKGRMSKIRAFLKP